jgi:hypothetical protein
MSNVELPSSVEQLGTSNHKATLEHYSGVDNRGGVTRNKDEKISRIAETVVSDRQPVKDIIRNVIEKDPLIRNSAKRRSRPALGRGPVTFMVIVPLLRHYSACGPSRFAKASKVLCKRSVETAQPCTYAEWQESRLPDRHASASNFSVPSNIPCIGSFPTSHSRCPCPKSQTVGHIRKRTCPGLLQRLELNPTVARNL